MDNNMLYSKSNQVTGERRLWLEVIYQAIEDATRIDLLTELLEVNRWKPMRLSAVKAELFEAQRSLAWLTTPIKDLTEVCCLAGIDVNAVLDRRDQYKAGKSRVSSTELHLLARSIDASINSD